MVKEKDYEKKFWRSNYRIGKYYKWIRKWWLKFRRFSKKFEEGMKISKECSKMLESAEKKITILLNDDGELKEKDLDTE